MPTFVGPAVGKFITGGDEGASVGIIIVGDCVSGGVVFGFVGSIVATGAKVGDGGFVGRNVGKAGIVGRLVGLFVGSLGCNGLYL